MTLPEIDGFYKHMQDVYKAIEKQNREIEAASRR